MRQRQSGWFTHGVLPLLAAGCFALVGATANATAQPQQEFGVLTDDPWCSEQRWDRDAHCEVREATLPASALDVDAGTNGSISVEAWDRDEVRVHARVGVDMDSRADSREFAERIRIHARDGRIYAEGPRTTERNTSWWVSYRIMVPRTTDMTLEANNGGISIEGVHGNMRFDTQNGGVTLVAVGGNVAGHTQNGGVRVRLAGSTWEGAGLDVTTTNGGVRLAVPSDYSAHLETGTVNGSVEIDFPVTVQGRITGSLSVDLGSGGPPVRVKTTNGSVRVSSER